MRRGGRPRALSPACRGLLRERLGQGSGGALPFLEAVIVQCAFPLGLDLPPDERAERERDTALLALELLLGATPAGGTADHEAAAGRLRRYPALLAAFFQNIDLLYRHGYPRADAVSLLVMHALDGPHDGAGAGISEPFPAERG